MEIKELVLPESYKNTIFKAYKELDQKYNNIFVKFNTDMYNGGLRKNNFAREFVKELDLLESALPKPDKEFWEKVKKLNKDNFKKFNISIRFAPQPNYLFLNYSNEYTIKFHYNEVEIIRQQYILLQELANKRGRNETII